MRRLCSREVSKVESGESAGIAVRKCQRSCLVKVRCCQDWCQRRNEGAGDAVRRCQRWSLVKVPCCPEVSEVEFGEGAGHAVRRCQRWSLVKVPAMLSGSVRG